MNVIFIDCLKCGYQEYKNPEIFNPEKCTCANCGASTDDEWYVEDEDETDNQEIE